jgi:hypothetical protein
MKTKLFFYVVILLTTINIISSDTARGSSPLTEPTRFQGSSDLRKFEVEPKKFVSFSVLNVDKSEKYTSAKEEDITLAKEVLKKIMKHENYTVLNFSEDLRSISVLVKERSFSVLAEYPGGQIFGRSFEKSLSDLNAIYS